MEERTITRRGLLARGAALVGALAMPAACGGNDTSLTKTTSTPTTTGGGDQVGVFRLSVECEGEKRCACNACVKHAANKVFASSDAANANRAHTHCNCVVAPAGSLPRRTYVDLFGEPGNVRVQAVDRRAQGVARKLRAISS